MFTVLFFYFEILIAFSFAVALALELIDDSTQSVRYAAGEIVHILIEKGPKPDVVKRAVAALQGKKRTTAEEILSKIRSKQSGPMGTSIAAAVQQTESVTVSRKEKVTTNDSEQTLPVKVKGLESE